jgi:hypothetical protein
MVATSGNEAFDMLALFPRQALLLFALLYHRYGAGALFKGAFLETHRAKTYGKHFLWSFAAIVIVEIGLKYWNLESFVHRHIESVQFGIRHSDWSGFLFGGILIGE